MLSLLYQIIVGAVLFRAKSLYLTVKYSLDQLLQAMVVQ